MQALLLRMVKKFERNASYIGTDRKYSGYELYADLETGELYAADAW